MNMHSFVGHAARLSRAMIAFFAAYSAVTGYLLAPHHALSAGLLLAVAVFLLAAGASALNQYQERHIDALMERTRRRPLPSGVLSPALAFMTAAALIGTGSLLLIRTGGTVPALLGFSAVAWYNGVYTYLKRVTAFAAVPGALVGMIPPAIGWTAGGGRMDDPRLFAVCLLFFIWQVPHFWLQVLHHGEEYEQAGLPSLTTALDKRGISRITFAWIWSAAAASLFLPLYGNLRAPVLYVPLLISAVWIMIRGARLVIAHQAPAPVLAAFRQLNIFMFVVMSLLSVEGIFLRMP